MKQFTYIPVVILLISAVILVSAMVSRPPEVQRIVRPEWYNPHFQAANSALPGNRRKCIEELEKIGRMFGKKVTQEAHYVALLTLQAVLYNGGNEQKAEVIGGRLSKGGDSSFPRDATYQAMSFEQKRQLHLAEEVLLFVVAQKEKIHGSTSPEIVPALQNLHVFYVMNVSTRNKADAVSRRIDKILEMAIIKNFDKPVVDLLNEAEKNPADGIAKLTKALPLQEERYGMGHEYSLWMLERLIKEYEKSGEHSHREQLYKDALARAEKLNGPMHPSLLPYLKKLGSQYMFSSFDLAGEKLFIRAVEVAKTSFGSDALPVARTLMDLFHYYNSYSGTIPDKELWLNNVKEKFREKKMLDILEEAGRVYRHYADRAPKDQHLSYDYMDTLRSLAGVFQYKKFVCLRLGKKVSDEEMQEVVSYREKFSALLKRCPDDLKLRLKTIPSG